jgi:hypothetical protein
MTEFRPTIKGPTLRCGRETFDNRALTETVGSWAVKPFEKTLDLQNCRQVTKPGFDAPGRITIKNGINSPAHRPRGAASNPL